MGSAEPRGVSEKRIACLERMCREESGHGTHERVHENEGEEHYQEPEQVGSRLRAEMPVQPRGRDSVEPEAEQQAADGRDETDADARESGQESSDDRGADNDDQQNVEQVHSV